MPNQNSSDVTCDDLDDEDWNAIANANNNEEINEVIRRKLKIKTAQSSF